MGNRRASLGPGPVAPAPPTDPAQLPAARQHREHCDQPNTCRHFEDSHHGADSAKDPTNIENRAPRTSWEKTLVGVLSPQSLRHPYSTGVPDDRCRRCSSFHPLLGRGSTQPGGRCRRPGADRPPGRTQSRLEGPRHGRQRHGPDRASRPTHRFLRSSRAVRRQRDRQLRLGLPGQPGVPGQLLGLPDLGCFQSAESDAPNLDHLPRQPGRPLGLRESPLHFDPGHQRAARLRPPGRHRHGERRAISRGPDLRYQRPRPPQSSGGGANLSRLPHPHAGDGPERPGEPLRLCPRDERGAFSQGIGRLLRPGAGPGPEHVALPDRSHSGATRGTPGRPDRQHAPDLRRREGQHCRPRESREQR